jgi:large subunit ribosomal protein L5
VSKKEAKQQKKGKAPKEAPEAVPQEPGKKAKGPRGPSEPSRLRVRYSKEIVPALMKHFSYTNVMAVPKLEKIVINMGLGEAVANAKILDVAVAELGQIAGQRPVITRAKKSIANFKLRQNMPIGAAVTLRGERMFEFLDRLTNVVLPRVRDFRGVSTKSFDGRGNYTLGLRDQLIFPEISYEKVDKIRGMNVTIVTTARSDDEARELLKQLGMPFRQ